MFGPMNDPFHLQRVKMMPYQKLTISGWKCVCRAVRKGIEASSYLTPVLCFGQPK